MKLVTTPNPPCAATSSTKLKPVQKVAELDNGLREKPRCWQNNTKKKEEDTPSFFDVLEATRKRTKE